MLFMLSASLALFLLMVTCMASNVQDDWVFPQSPDYSTVLQLGKEYTVQWTSALQDWVDSYCPDCSPYSVDLWITSSNQQYQHKVAAAVDVTSSLGIAWEATVSTAELSNTQAWVLRFLPSGQDPRWTSEEISSSVFIIDAEGASSSSTPGSSTNPTTSPRSSSGLSPGAAAGIGIGVTLGAILLFALGWYIARCRRSTPASARVGWWHGKTSYDPYGTGSQTAHSNSPRKSYCLHMILKIKLFEKIY
ncbi:hypothetical protein F4859DRAFT_484739 [Xylaria cf. heliscus]|nr:hypothetical protein F4859DRAFT_484739 [Xylaria cf. heliscus]